MTLQPIVLCVVAGASAPGYVESINSCHLLPAPSRVLKLQELPAALDYFAKLLADLQRACRIIEVADYRGLKAALAAFSAGTPSAVARCATPWPCCCKHRIIIVLVLYPAWLLVMLVTGLLP